MRLNATSRRLTPEEYKELVARTTPEECRKREQSPQYRQYLEGKNRGELKPIVLEKEDEIVFTEDEETEMHE